MGTGDQISPSEGTGQGHQERPWAATGAHGVLVPGREQQGHGHPIVVQQVTQQLHAGGGTMTHRFPPAGVKEVSSESSKCSNL